MKDEVLYLRHYALDGHKEQIVLPLLSVCVSWQLNTVQRVDKTI
jgi:hypothetical protein